MILDLGCNTVTIALLSGRCNVVGVNVDSHGTAINNRSYKQRWDKADLLLYYTVYSRLCAKTFVI